MAVNSSKSTRQFAECFSVFYEWMKKLYLIEMDVCFKTQAITH